MRRLVGEGPTKLLTQNVEMYVLCPTVGYSQYHETQYRTSAHASMSDTPRISSKSFRSEANEV